MEIKTSRDILGRFDEHFESRSDEMTKQLDSEKWVSLDSLKEYIESNKEFIYTRDEGCYSEEKRRMLWITKLLGNLT